MKIQYISFDGEEKQNTNKNITYNKFNNAVSFDEYDLNIISLLNANIWTCKDQELCSIDCIKDLYSLNHQILSALKSKTIIALPQNFKFWYFKKSVNSGYHHFIQLKDCVSFWSGSILSTSLLGSIFYLKDFVIYDNCNTLIGDKKIQSAFYFNTSSYLTCSVAGHSTTMEIGNGVIITGLNFKQSGFDLDTFLTEIGLLNKTEYIPDWLNKYKILNDSELEKDLKNEKERLSMVHNKIDELEKQIQDNLYYKKALITNGEELVNIIFDILEKILDCDLSDFDDIKKEDFLIEKNGYIFIGEIKGVTTNVKSENVSQLDVHYQSYIENNPRVDKEKVKALLIMNPFRTKDIEHRDPVHENQIQLAKRNGSLIITTETLLKLFEKFKRNEIDTNQIIELFMSKSGQLKIEDF